MLHSAALRIKQYLTHKTDQTFPPWRVKVMVQRILKRNENELNNTFFSADIIVSTGGVSMEAKAYMKALLITIGTTI